MFVSGVEFRAKVFHFVQFCQFSPLDVTDKKFD